MNGNYNGPALEKWERLQIEINADKVLSVSFKKTPEEKVALWNAKRDHKRFVRENPDYQGLK